MINIEKIKIKQDMLRKAYERRVHKISARCLKEHILVAQIYAVKAVE